MGVTAQMAERPWLSVAALLQQDLARIGYPSLRVSHCIAFKQGLQRGIVDGEDEVDGPIGIGGQLYAKALQVLGHVHWFEAACTVAPADQYRRRTRRQRAQVDIQLGAGCQAALQQTTKHGH